MTPNWSVQLPDGAYDGDDPDYQSWLLWPTAFGDIGFPIQTDGTSTVVDGLYFVGVPYHGSAS